MSANVRVYVNGRGVDAPADGSPVDAVRLIDPALAGEVDGGARRITDSRGLPVVDGEALYNGAIFRVVANRQRAGEGDDA
jgi:hypothetical protein